MLIFLYFLALCLYCYAIFISYPPLHPTSSHPLFGFSKIDTHTIYLRLFLDSLNKSAEYVQNVYFLLYFNFLFVEKLSKPIFPYFIVYIAVSIINCYNFHASISASTLVYFKRIRYRVTICISIYSTQFPFLLTLFFLFFFSFTYYFGNYNWCVKKKNDFELKIKLSLFYFKLFVQEKRHPRNSISRKTDPLLRM